MQILAKNCVNYENNDVNVSLLSIFRAPIEPLIRLSTGIFLHLTTLPFLYFLIIVLLIRTAEYLKRKRLFDNFKARAGALVATKIG